MATSKYYVHTCAIIVYIIIKYNIFFRLFTDTKVAAEDPLKAAGVYKNIVQAIEEAENATKAASEAATFVKVCNLLFIIYWIEMSVENLLIAVNSIY